MSLSKENKVIIDGQTYYGGLNQPNLKFIKVNVDCWERIFDFLSLRDILAMSQTCQRMRQIGGYYFRQNFHGTACKLSESSSDLHIFIADKPMERIDFLRFIDTVQIAFKCEYLRTASSMGLLISLTTLHLYHINLSEHQLHGLGTIQNSIETIELRFCSIDDNSVGEFLASCPKLKSLRFTDVNYKLAEAKASLFQRTYPILEHVKFEYCEDIAFELPSFLEQNPSIKCLETDYFLKIPLDTSTAQLDYLSIGLSNEVDFNKLLNRLKALYAKEFYKKLRLVAAQLNNSASSEMFMREMTSFSALEAFYTVRSYTDAINYMSQLKELHLHAIENEVDFETMALNLVNLERLAMTTMIGTLQVRELLPFLCHSKKLKFVYFSSGKNALNLKNLNELRRISGSQRKLQIGLHDEQYLATKWKDNNLIYDLVEITRANTIRKYFDFK